MRLLVACPKCKQKYDASARRVGGRFRCRCGEVVTIRAPQAHDAEVVHCVACGAAREEGARACKFCGSDFTIHEQDLNTVCPGCLARVSDKARYCHHCATLLSVEAVAGAETTHLCPLCMDRPLATRRLESIQVSALECQVCAGLWIGIESFYDFLVAEQSGNRGATVSHRIPEVQPPNAKRYRPCPICTKLMTFHCIKGSGIILDVCGEHGLWFDCEELSHTVSWIRSGGLKSALEDLAILSGSPDAVRRKVWLEKMAPAKPLKGLAGGFGYEAAEILGRDRHQDFPLDDVVAAIIKAGSSFIDWLKPK